MKRILLLAVPALALLAACTKTEVKPAQTEPQQVAFTPLTGKLSTRTLIDGTTYATTAPSFGTFAYYLEEGKTWDANITDASLFIPVSAVKYNATINYWTTDKPYFWPKSGGVTFFAYSPYSYQDGGVSTDLAVTPGTDKDGFSISGYDVDTHQLTDFMVADVTKSKDKSANETNGGYTGVPIVFQHKLSQIVGINLKTVKTSGTSLVEHDYANSHDGTSGKEYEAGDVVFKLKNVSIKLLNTKGDFKYASTTTAAPTSVWSNHTAPKAEYVWYDYTADNVAGNPEQFAGNTKFELSYNNKHTANANAYLLVLPQPLTERSAAATLDKPYLHIEYQVLTYTDATNYSTENVTENIDLYLIHGGTAGAATADIEIAQNKKISYLIQINLENRQIYWAPSVENWADQSYTFNR